VVTTAPNGYQRYMKTRIETASQPQLLVMLFDAAVKKLHIARKAMEEKDIELTHNELIKVQRIFSELMVALDFNLGGDLANQLYAIYDFVYRQLVQANIRRDTKLVDEVLPIVEDLREGWTKAVAKFQEETKEGTTLGRNKIKSKDAAQIVVVQKSESQPDKSVPQPSVETPIPLDNGKNYSAVSPAQFAKPLPRTYTSQTPKKSTEEPVTRLNLRG